MGNGLIYVGIPRERFYITGFVDNRDRILAHLHNEGRECGYFQAESHRVDRNRDHIVRRFLDEPRRPEWLLMIDSDMEHPIDCGIRLASWGKPVVGALYFHRKNHDPVAFYKADKQKDEYGRDTQMWEPIRDRVYEWLIVNRVPMRDGALTIGNRPPKGLAPVDAVGTGCIIIHRSILEQMKPPWFEYRDGSQSEDLEFCDRVKKELGIKVYCDLSTISGHYQYVPMGQAQFRTQYEGRGYSLSSYTREQAASWLATFLNVSEDEARLTIESYDQKTLQDLWASSGKTDEDVLEFYKRDKVGYAYLCDLLHWNASPAFQAIRKTLIQYRDIRILEIGSGIGTIAAQLALQGNAVTTVEPNSVLRSFSMHRWKWCMDRAFSWFGPIEHLDDISKVTGQFDLAVAIDVFEHIPEKPLLQLLKQVSSHLRPGRRMFFHNNFEMQDVYPMHYNHSGFFGEALRQSGFFQPDPMWAIKVNER